MMRRLMLIKILSSRCDTIFKQDVGYHRDILNCTRKNFQLNAWTSRSGRALRFGPTLGILCVDFHGG